MYFINLLVLVIGMAICHLLCLTYIGVTKKVKAIIIPIILLSIVAFISRAILNASYQVNTIVILFTNMILVKTFNSEISWIVSATGSLLNQLTFELVGLMVPFLNYKLGINPIIEHNTWGWVYLNLAEYTVPLFVLIILKVKKISLFRYLQKSE
ncbi:MAG: hypothetical protein K6U80_00165 [Firmicutes bacterium]|nr:hypothetical protein [Bacillota bacterium]